MTNNDISHCECDQKNIAIVEPYFSGSHSQLIHTLLDGIDFHKEGKIHGVDLFQLPGKKWQWRQRSSALHFSLHIPEKHNYKLLFATSVLNLAELCALRPDIASISNKILYFHENQLAYPVRHQKLSSNTQFRDFQFGYSQILSCLVATKVYFNSAWNMNSFLNSVQSYLAIQPSDQQHKNVAEKIRHKCDVLHYPIELPMHAMNLKGKYEETRIHIVWPHRWEHDKGPDALFEVIMALVSKGCNFHLSVLGQQFSEQPEIFRQAKEKLENEASSQCKILNWGYMSSKEKYLEVLSSAHVVVSTAVHEFYGVSMIEAALIGCFPLCPDNLSYPELFPSSFRYRTRTQLVKKLANFCKNPQKSIHYISKVMQELKPDLEKFTWHALKEKYEDILLLNNV